MESGVSPEGFKKGGGESSLFRMPFTFLKSRSIDIGRWILTDAMFSKDSGSRESPQKGHFMEGSHWGSNV